VRALKGSAIAIGKAGAQDGFMELVAYERRDVDIKEWNPTALEVFAFVRDSLATMLPGHDVEHIGSTSVPGLRGKGIIDVMVLAKDDADTAHIATQLEALGLQHRAGRSHHVPSSSLASSTTAVPARFTFTWCALGQTRQPPSVGSP